MPEAPVIQLVGWKLEGQNMDPVAQLCETGEDRFCVFLDHRKSWIGSRQSSCSCFQSFVSLDGLECSRISLMSVKEDTS